MTAARSRAGAGTAALLTRGAGWCIAAVLAVAAGVAAGPARAGLAAGRVSEPVLVAGRRLAVLAGAPLTELSVWAWDQGSGWRPVLFQVDERDDSGFVAAEDGRLDGNDVLVFMADQLGDERPPGTWPPALGSEHPHVEIQVTDPLDAGFDGRAYVFRTPPELIPPTGPPLVVFDAARAEVRTASYTLGFARAGPDGFVGLKRLSLFGSPQDLLDRVKFRATVGVFPLTLHLTEEDLASLGLDLLPDPLIQGPVRLVLDSGGVATAYASRMSLFGDLAQIPVPGGLTPRDVRVSLDLSPAAVPATYRDANVPAGVPIDGRPDAVPGSPLPRWRELVFAAGRVVFLGRQTTGRARVYYRDDATTRASDTGDGKAYGDNGVEASTLDDLLASGFPGQMVVLGPGEPPDAARLLDQLDHPLEVALVGHTAQTPTPVPTPASPTPTLTATATVTATATRPADLRFDLFLPLVRR